MTGKGDFTDEEWELLREGPAVAGMMVVMADRGGTLRETFAMAKAYGEARNQHGESELLDELVAAGPKRGGRYHSNEELSAQGQQRLREAADLLARKATSSELEDYRAFVLTLAKKVADAHREHDQQVSEREHATIRDIEASLGAPSA
jgi:glutamate synthase domain-containing protein 1